MNIEIKSREVEKEKIHKQLMQNRYYLSNVGTEIYSFCFVKGEEKNIWYMCDQSLKECSITEVLMALNRINDYVDERIEEHFRPQEYLISPLNTPEKFIEGKYYLTNQQEEIKKEILGGLKEKKGIIWGITGTAGTGKTLLLYDIAKELSGHGKTCIIHCGILSEGHTRLNGKINNLDIIAAKSVCAEIIRNYHYLLVDEAQRIYRSTYDTIMDVHKEGTAQCVFSYDFYQILSYAEQRRNIPQQLNERDDFMEKRLSEKIRTNKEVASFIRNMIDLSDRSQKKMDYRNIEILYANNMHEADKIVEYYCLTKKYTFISYTPSKYHGNSIDHFSNYVNTHHVIGQEFDNVIFAMDNNFRYAEDGRLQGREHPNPDYIFYKLWYQGVSRTRERLCILVIENKDLFLKLLSIKG